MFMVYEYEYEKESGFNVDKLADEIEAALGKKVKKTLEEDVVVGYINGAGNKVTIIFDSELTEDELSTLDVVIQDHVV